MTAHNPSRSTICPGCLRRVRFEPEGYLGVHHHTITGGGYCYGSGRTPRKVAAAIAFSDDDGRRLLTVEPGALLFGAVAEELRKSRERAGREVVDEEIEDDAIVAVLSVLGSLPNRH